LEPKINRHGCPVHFTCRFGGSRPSKSVLYRLVAFQVVPKSSRPRKKSLVKQKKFSGVFGKHAVFAAVVSWWFSNTPYRHHARFTSGAVRVNRCCPIHQHLVGGVQFWLALSTCGNHTACGSSRQIFPSGCSCVASPRPGVKGHLNNNNQLFLPRLLTLMTPSCQHN